MKYFIIFIILMFNNSDCFSQIIYNRIPEPIVKEKGKCIVYYKKKNKLVYIKNTDIVDWKNSLIKIDKSENIDKSHIYFIEKFRQKKNVRTGNYELINLKLDSSSTNLSLSPQYIYESGKYVNGLKNGVIRVLNDFIEFKGRDYYDLRLGPHDVFNRYQGYYFIDYELGKIKNQIITYPHSIRYNYNQEVKPYVSFKNGEVDEVLSFIENNYSEENRFNLVSKKCNQNYCVVLQYAPLSRFYKDVKIPLYKFLTVDEIEERKGGGLYNFRTFWDNTLNEELYSDGVIKVSPRKFDKSNNLVLFDTSKVTTLMTIKDQKLNGLSTYKGENDKLKIKLNFKNDTVDGSCKAYTNNGNLSMECNFKDGNLNGAYKTFFPDGKLKEVYNFEDGILAGKSEIYISKQDEYNFRFPKEIIDKSTFLNDYFYSNEFSIYDMVIKKPENIVDLFKKKKNNYYASIASILAFISKRDNNDINTHYNLVEDLPSYFKFTELNYEYLSSAKKSILNDYSLKFDTTVLYTRFISKCNDCFEVYDKSGAVILDNLTLNKTINIEQRKLKEQENKLLESSINCKWCRKEFIFKSGSVLTDCKCFKNETRKDSVSVLINSEIYCSPKCKSDAERECCRRNGYIH